MVAALAVLPGAAPLASLDLDVTGLRSTRGLIQVCVTMRAADFPDACDKDPAARKLTVPATHTGPLRFADMPPGGYAIALFHDENGNGRLDKRFGFVPLEGIGFSNNARIRFGPPSFATARFTLTDQPQEETVKLQYFL